MKRKPLSKFSFWIESINHRIKIVGGKNTATLSADNANLRKGDILEVRLGNETHKFKYE